MRTTISHLYASSLLIGVILAGQALAQDEASSPANVSPQSVPITQRDAGPEFGPEEGRLIGEEEPGTDAIFGNVPPPGCEACGGGECVPPCWHVESGAGFLVRSRPRKIQLSLRSTSGQFTAATNPVTLYSYGNDIFNSPLLDTHTATFSPSSALDFGLSRYLGRDGNNRDHFLEFKFWGLAEWNQKTAVRGAPNPNYDLSNFAPTPDSTAVPPIQYFAGNLRSPFALTEPLFITPDESPAIFLSSGFNRATQHTVNYRSRFNSFEINNEIKARNTEDQLVLHPNGRWYRQCRPGIYCSYLFGLRAMTINESFQFGATGQIDGTDEIGGLTYQTAGRYSIHTENNLFGVQMGGSIEYRLCRWQFDMHGKVTPSLNVVSQSSHVSTAVNGVEVYDLTWGARKNASAVYGELGFGAQYKFRPNLMAHASYDLIWVGGLALAAEQLNFQPAPVPRVTTGGSAFINGATFGLDYTW